MSIQLRPATEQDQALLLRVYASTRTEELAATGWPEAQCQQFLHLQFEAQQRHYWQRCPASQCQVIELDGRPVGRLWLDRRASALHVLDISLLGEARGRGVGSHCLRRLMAEAGHLPLTIYVELHNPARRLYERLGFRAEGAADGLHQRMLWRALTPHPRTEECQPC